MTKRTWAGTLAQATGLQARGTVTGDLLIPLAASVVTGTLSGLLAQALDWPGVVIGLAAALIAWLLRPGAVVLPAVEIGAPKAEMAQTVRLTITNLDGRQADYLQLGISPEQLQALAIGLTGGASLSTRQWTGTRATFSQAEFARLRSVLIARGLARWVSDRDPRSGCVVTAKGAATFRGLARPHPGVPTGLQSTQGGG